MGAWWWLLCRPSPAVSQASHCEVARQVGVGAATEGVAGGVHRRAEGQVGDGVDQPAPAVPATGRGRRRAGRRRWPGRGRRGRTGSDPSGRGAGRGSTWPPCPCRRPPAVEDDVAQLHREVPEQDGGVGVALLVGVGVVLAVHRHPLAGADAGGDPGSTRKTAVTRGDRRRALWARARCRKVVVTRLASWVTAKARTRARRGDRTIGA